jgi:ribosomal protein S6
MVLLDNREVRQGWDTLKDSVAGMLSKHNAKIISSRLWEERRLAFPINRQLRGTYLLVYFDAPTNEITPINREFQMAESILRHMVTACDEVPESAHEPEKEFDVSAIGIEKEPEPEAAAAVSEDTEKEKSKSKSKEDDAAKPEKSETGGEKATADAEKSETGGEKATADTEKSEAGGEKATADAEKSEATESSDDAAASDAPAEGETKEDS